MSLAVSIKNLSHKYEKNEILKNISFNIEKGSFFIIIGPNGSGKTTLLKNIAGMEKFSNGNISILEKNLKKYSTRELAKKIAFVPQTVSLDFPFSVFEIVRMGRSPHLGLLGSESDSDIQTIKKAMKFTDIEHLAKRKIHQLSGGECQRTSIARAICQEPQIMLLDEPTAALDIGHQTKIMDLMEKLKKEQGMTIIMISHDVNLAALYADNILVLKDGEVISQGNPKDVITYETLEIAYECVVLVDDSPFGNHPRISLVPEKYGRI